MVVALVIRLHGEAQGVYQPVEMVSRPSLGVMTTGTSEAIASAARLATVVNSVSVATAMCGPCCWVAVVGQEQHWRQVPPL